MNNSPDQFETNKTLLHVALAVYTHLQQTTPMAFDAALTAVEAAWNNMHTRQRNAREVEDPRWRAWREELDQFIADCEAEKARVAQTIERLRAEAHQKAGTVSADPTSEEATANPAGWPEKLGKYSDWIRAENERVAPTARVLSSLEPAGSGASESKRRAQKKAGPSAPRAQRSKKPSPRKPRKGHQQ